MGCENCKSDMAQIMYIEHKRRLFKFYQKYKRLKFALIITNIIWAGIVIVLSVLLVMR